MVDLILSLVITALLVFAYRQVRVKMDDAKAIQTILCVVIAVGIGVAAMCTLFSLVILLLP